MTQLRGQRYMGGTFDHPSDGDAFEKTVVMLQEQAKKTVEREGVLRTTQYLRKLKEQAEEIRKLKERPGWPCDYDRLYDWPCNHDRVI